MVYKHFRFEQPVLYTSREPRQNEIDGQDFIFRSEEFIKNLPQDDFIIGPVRHLWQALDIKMTKNILQKENIIILEAYPTLVDTIIKHKSFSSLFEKHKVTSVFIKPFTDEELATIQKVNNLNSPAEAATHIMTPKLLSRYQQQNKLLTPAVLKDVQIRASHAWEEVQWSKNYSHVIINHDGEDSINWKYTPPIGEAGNTLQAFYEIINNI